MCLCFLSATPFWWWVWGQNVYYNAISGKKGCKGLEISPPPPPPAKSSLYQNEVQQWTQKFPKIVKASDLSFSYKYPLIDGTCEAPQLKRWIILNLRWRGRKFLKCSNTTRWTKIHSFIRWIYFAMIHNKFQHTLAFEWPDPTCHKLLESKIFDRTESGLTTEPEVVV